MASIIMAVIMGGLGGPAMAWALNSPKNRKGYADRKAKFEAGQGADPDKAPFGPHKPFATNALLFGAILAIVGFMIGRMA